MEKFNIKPATSKACSFSKTTKMRTFGMVGIRLERNGH